WLSTITSLTGKVYSGEDRVYAQTSALVAINVLLRDMELKDVHYLLAWSMLRLLVPFANGNFFASKHSDSARACVARVEAIMQPALWAPYFFNETWTDTVAKAKLTISDLRRALRSRLEKAAWMDADSRKSALRKLDNMDIFTGFPDAVTDEKSLNKYYVDIGSFSLSNEAIFHSGPKCSETVQNKIIQLHVIKKNALKIKYHIKSLKYYIPKLLSLDPGYDIDAVGERGLIL
uniref:Peptidase M13 N-terminal domain-containing protein n=2 Tax=Ixodes scapularis TaxID=6945 RepID=A0A1S4KT93_IXOSC